MSLCIIHPGNGVGERNCQGQVLSAQNGDYLRWNRAVSRFAEELDLGEVGTGTGTVPEIVAIRSDIFVQLHCAVEQGFHAIYFGIFRRATGYCRLL